MNLSPLDQINNQTKPTQASPDALRKAAVQFEAILLMKLTSALNSTSGDDEDSLFGSDGGSGLAKQMFSEQLASTMAQSGGIGLADMILRQAGVAGTKSPTGIKGLLNTASEPKFKLPASHFGGSPVMSKTVEAAPGAAVPGDAGEAQIISTFEDQVRAEGIDDSLAHLVLDGRIVNTTRARVVPNAIVREISETGTGDLTGASGVEPASVAYQSPVHGRVSSGYGNRFHPIDRRAKFHGGMDIAVPSGTPVAASAGGVVTFAGWQGGYGNLVVIEHADGRTTRYGHLSKLVSARDDVVSAGQLIALSGSTGRSTGPHLHFEVRENGQAVNPSKVLSNVFPNNAER